MSDQPTPPTPPAQPPEDATPQDSMPPSSQPSQPSQPRVTSSPQAAAPRSTPSSSPLPDRVTQVLQTSQQIAQTTWVKVRPTAIQGLRSMTSQLQRLTTELEAQVEADPNKVDPIDFTPVVQTTQTVWEKLYPVWKFAIDQLRPRLPEPLKPLSDRALSGVVLGTLLLLLWFLSAIPSGKATPAPVAPTAPITRPAPSSRPPSASVARSVDTSRSQAQPVPQSLTAPDSRSTLASPVAAPAIAPPTAQPSSAQSSTAQPSTAQASTAPLPLAGATPSVPLSPEQKLLAFLQEPLQNQEPSDTQVIVAAKPQAAAGSLQVIVNDRWRLLNPTSQDRLANTLLQQAQQKNFTELELVDSEDTVLARSPIVGSEMVILHRR
ncbi:hypothetical protein [Alkalinema sp. FACHB-956]|uniref:hypothetical protein n=1 Tax=Alkalinema sp. FACHB-956 TaxID=2692768 RepID=UPI00168807F7|nr:hypothetical protein [Alkalinema sp. FACHB-956]MBD2326462.1 hypothetical protein [Alkalinema sp. FACHB-956]